MPVIEHVDLAPAELHFDAMELDSISSMSPDGPALQTLGMEDLSELLNCFGGEQDSANNSPAAPKSTSCRRLSPLRKRSLDSDDDTKHANIRMRTYTARKNEIEALSEELPSLEAYVDYLKHEAAKVNNQTNSTQKQQLVNSCLRDIVHSQEFTLARIHSALSAFTTRQEKLIPFDNYIHLQKDKKQRLQTLLAIRPRMLRDARRFMQERTGFLDLSVPISEQSCFVNPAGDYCALKFVVMPLDGDFSAKQVFDTLKFYLFHMEIMISEATGDLTLCEEEEPDNQAASQHRFLRSTPSGYQVESNDVLFCQFDEKNDEFGDGREYGVIAIDFVDRDDLHPYYPDQNLRQDLTSILTVQTYKRQVPSPLNSRKLQTKVEVVMARTNFFKLHQTALPLSSFEMQETIDRLACRGNLLFNAVRTSLMTSTKTEE